MIATRKGPVSTDTGGLTLPATHDWSDSAVDVLVIPGGRGVDAIAEDSGFMEHLTQAQTQAGEVLTVCTGAVLLARTGCVAGRRATTHWAHRVQLAGLGVEVSEERTCRDGAWWSGAGVSAGGLSVVARTLVPSAAARVATWLPMWP